MTLLSSLMNTESQFSQILPSRNLLIALEPNGPSKFRKKYGTITHIHGNRKTHQTKLFVSTALEKAKGRHVTLRTMALPLSENR